MDTSPVSSAVDRIDTKAISTVSQLLNGDVQPSIHQSSVEKGQCFCDDAIRNDADADDVQSNIVT